MTDKPKIFDVIEYQSGFAVRHLLSGEEHWMSDGVDVLFDQDEKAISPGTEGFTDKWAESLNFNPSETMEAYFRTIDYEVIPRFQDFIAESIDGIKAAWERNSGEEMPDEYAQNLKDSLTDMLLAHQEEFKRK